MNATASFLSGGRLHLRHGPIDCLVRAWGEPREVAAAYSQAEAAFPAILPALCQELRRLRAPLPSMPPAGPIAQRMHGACMPYADRFITPMAAVAGAVADHLLAALCTGRRLNRAFVNNGGDIAFHLAPGRSLRCGLVADLGAPALDGVFRLEAAFPARGIATSGRACKGRGGRSFSLGVADAVTVLAADAARADAAATMIANAVDLPGHAAIIRRPARTIDPDSDLGERMVTLDVGILSRDEIDAALDSGLARAKAARAVGLIGGAVLALRGRMRCVGLGELLLQEPS
ncbi:MAG TPA: UPF0280 family protein [Acetobacteraceae bacterium]|nr:UPF0280 family protein [Acetobacteraceae bacterium]